MNQVKKNLNCNKNKCKKELNIMTKCIKKNCKNKMNKINKNSLKKKAKNIKNCGMKHCAKEHNAVNKSKNSKDFNKKINDLLKLGKCMNQHCRSKVNPKKLKKPTKKLINCMVKNCRNKSLKYSECRMKKC